MPSRVGKNVFFLRRGRAKLTGGALAEGGRCESIPTRPAGRSQWAFIAFDVSRRHFLHVGIHLFFFFPVLFANKSAVKFYTPPGQIPCLFQGKKKKRAARHRSDRGPTAGADPRAAVSRPGSSCPWGFGSLCSVRVGTGDETHRDGHEVREQRRVS